MSCSPPPGAWTWPATARNREPILAVLREHLPARGRVLEIASGSGEHAVFFAGALPGLDWQPTDSDPGAIGSIEAWRDAAHLPNLRPPLRLDVTELEAWPPGEFDAVICINMIHIAPWSAAEALVRGAGRRLSPGGRLFLYGPFLEADVPTAAGNLDFDASLKARDPAWGVRDLEEVTALAAASGLERTARIAMPANNLSVVFERR